MAENLVTGATGLVGHNIARVLREQGKAVRVLARDPQRAAGIVPEGCEIVAGDLAAPASLRAACNGVAVVYHAAGLPEQWLPDIDTFRRVNVEGTRNMLAAANECNVRRFVYTSTIDVFQAARGADYDESVIDPEPKGTAYERSKQAADQLVVAAVGEGMDAVFLHPSGVYGPGPTASPGLNTFITDLNQGKIPMLLPGGFPVVYGDDVARGHITAAEQAAAGARYILSECYYSLAETATIVGEALGRRGAPPVMPLWLGHIVAHAGEALSSVIQRPPLIPKGQLHFMQWQARPSSAKAQRELGWRPTPLAEGMAKTVAWLREQGRI